MGVASPSWSKVKAMNKLSDYTLVLRGRTGMRMHHRYIYT